MLQSGAEPDLVEETLWAERRSQLGSEDLERDRPVVAEIVCQVDRSHSTAAQLALETVGLGQRGLETGQQVGQTRSGEGDGPRLNGGSREAEGAVWSVHVS